MDRKIAEQIVALANSCIDQLLSSLAPVEQAVSPEEFAAYKRHRQSPEGDRLGSHRRDRP